MKAPSAPASGKETPLKLSVCLSWSRRFTLIIEYNLSRHLAPMILIVNEVNSIINSVQDTINITPSRHKRHKSCKRS